MIGTNLQVALLLLSSLSLVGLGVSGVLVSRAQRQRQRLDNRFALITRPHMRQQPIVLSAFTRQESKRERTLLDSAATVFGINTEQSDIYPVQWWLALLVALGVANIARVMIQFLAGGMATLAMPVLWVMFSRAFFNWAEKRQRDKMLNQFPDALAMIVRSVRVGIPVMEAMRAVARESPEPTRTQFDQLVKAVAVGGTLEDAVTEMARRSSLAEYRFFATALSLQTQTGGTLSDTLEGLADVIRKRMALKAKGYAMTSEARMSTLVLAILPGGIGTMLWLINPSYIAVLFDDATGKKILGGAIVSLTVGLYVVRTIIRKTLP